MTRTRATAIGFIAVLLWALLALFTVGSSPTPPLLLNTICFSIGGTLGLVWTWVSGGLRQLRAVPITTYLFGIAGLFGYHALYFSALRMAPAAEAGLIAYLWPLLIVLMSGLLPGERLRAGHLLGGALGFAGAALIILGDGASPSGMAVTSSRPVCFARRNAMKKNARSPIKTPNAVPGTIAETANSVGNPNPLSNPTINNSPATLSSIKPKKALMSPIFAH